MQVKVDFQAMVCPARALFPWWFPWLSPPIPPQDHRQEQTVGDGAWKYEI